MQFTAPLPPCPAVSRSYPLDAPVGKDFSLPDRDPKLELFDDVTAGDEGLVPMR